MYILSVLLCVALYASVCVCKHVCDMKTLFQTIPLILAAVVLMLWSIMWKPSEDQPAEIDHIRTSSMHNKDTRLSILISDFFSFLLLTEHIWYCLLGKGHDHVSEGAQHIFFVYSLMVRAVRRSYKLKTMYMIGSVAQSFSFLRDHGGYRYGDIYSSVL